MSFPNGWRMTVVPRRNWPRRNRGKLAELAVPSLLAALALACPTGAARAAFTSFFGIDQGNGTPPTTPTLSLAARTSFLSALDTAGVADFESAGAGTPPASLSFVGSGITATATYAATESINNATDSGAFATSGTHYLDAAQGLRGDHLVFS